MAAVPSRRVKAPVSRFSSTVRWPKQWRPSITWMQPRRTSSLGESACDLGAIEYDRALGDLAALGVQQVGDRLQRGGLAGAVGAEQRHDAALRHRQRHALEHQDDVVVDHLDIVERRMATVAVTDAAYWSDGGHQMLAPARAAQPTGRSEVAGPMTGFACPVISARIGRYGFGTRRFASIRLAIHDGLSQGSVRFGQPVFFVDIFLGGSSRSAASPCPSSARSSRTTFTHLVPSHSARKRDAVAVMVAAGHMDGAAKPVQAQFLPARRR